jgi:hypothetical protein
VKRIGELLAGLTIAGVLVAQTPAPAETAPPAPPSEKRIFPVRYADVGALAHVLSVFGYHIEPDRGLHVLAVSAPHDAMTAIEDAVKQLDVPAAAPRDVDLIVYLILASQQAAGPGGIPPDLQPIANELQGLFSFKGFRTLDTILLRTKPGNTASANGVTGEADKTQYGFTVRPSAVTEDAKGRLIRLDDLKLNLTASGGMQAGINTEITVREGQKVVVGKSNIGGIDQALILVVTAKLTE